MKGFNGFVLGAAMADEIILVDLCGTERLPAADSAGDPQPEGPPAAGFDERP